MLGEMLEDELGSSLPTAVRDLFRTMLGILDELNVRICELDKEVARRAREDEFARRLMTLLGIGPIAATAIAALAPAMEMFRCGRDFAVWLGLTLMQKSSVGKARLGHISKMGERTLRQLLIIGARAVEQHANRRGAPEGFWLANMLARKPRMLISVAQAYKTERIVWAVLMTKQNCRARMVSE
jgi:transposase